MQITIITFRFRSKSLGLVELFVVIEETMPPLPQPQALVCYALKLKKGPGWEQQDLKPTSDQDKSEHLSTFVGLDREVRIEMNDLGTRWEEVRGTGMD